nr:hypothetical protein [Tanacetum cinerariifolium]
MHTAWDDCLLGTMGFVSRHEDTQVYGSLLPKAMTNQALLDSVAYKTYYAIATGGELPKPKKIQKKSDSAISSEETSSKKKHAKAKKDVTLIRSQLLNLNRLRRRHRKKDFHISHASSSGDGTDFESGVFDEKQHKICGIDKGIGAKSGVPDVPKYNYESHKESWGYSGEEDGNDDGDDSDSIVEDVDDDNDGNDDDDDRDYDRTESDIDENSNLNQSNKEHEEEEEYVDEFIDKEDDVDNAKEENEEELDDDDELYKDEEEDAHVTLIAIHDTQNTEGPMQSSSVSSDFTEKILNFKNVSPTDNEIASLMDIIILYEEPSGQTSSLFTVPITVIPEIGSTFTTTIPPPHPSFNPLPQQATRNPTPTASKVTTSFPLLPDFASVLRFNDKVTNLESDLFEMKQVDREEALDDSREYIDLIDTTAMLGRQLGALLQTQGQGEANSEASPQPEVYVLLSSYLLQYFFYKDDWFKKPKRPLTPYHDWNKRKHVDFKPPQTWISNIARAENPPTSFDELMDTSIDVSAFVMNRLNITNLTQELLVGPALNLLKVTSKSLISITIMKRYDYDHLDEVEVHREDQQLYKFNKVGQNLENRIQVVGQGMIQMLMMQISDPYMTKTAEVQLAAECNIFAIGQQHTEQPEIINEAQIQEKGFAIAALKNELRKLKENSVDTKFAKTSVLGKPILQSLRNQSVVRQPNAFKSKRPPISKPLFAFQVDVKNNLSKPVTQHYLPKRRAYAFAKPDILIASSSSKNSSKNMPRFSSNDMVHNYYLEEAKKKTQEKDRNSKTSVMPSTSQQNTTNDSKPKPRCNNQTSKSFPVSKINRETSNVVPLVDHYRNPSPFSDSKHFVCSTCHKCVFNANHDTCITKVLKKVNSRAKIQSHKTRNTSPRSGLRWQPTGRIIKIVGLRRIPTRKLLESCTGKVDSELPHGSNVYIFKIHACKQTLDLSAGTSLNGQKKQRIDLSAELESLFVPLFDEYFNGENKVALKYSAVTTAYTSVKCQQQPDSTSSTLTLATTVTADGNFDL